jgi:hypothetical protein
MKNQHPIHHHLLPMITALGVALSLTACGFRQTAAFNADSASFYSGAASEKAAAYDMTGGVRSAAASKNVSAWDESAVEYEDSGSTALTSDSAITPVPTTRKLIRTVHLSVETTAFTQLIDDISRSVDDLGGYMESSDISGNSISDSNGRRYAYLTVRVPSDKLDQFVTQVGEQGNITNKSENTQDVTLQYSDIESRKKSLTIEQKRLWELMEQADSVDSIIALESRLSEIRYQLESFESQLRTYDNQVDYSTVNVYIEEVKVLTPTAPDSITTRIQKGFRRNLEDTANGLINFFVWFVSSLPSLIVWAIIIILAVLIIRLLRRKLHHGPMHLPFPRRRSKSKETTSTEEKKES